MGDTEDFWPAIENVEDAHSPVVLLRKQAEKLTDKSGRRLRGRVSTTTGRLGMDAMRALGKVDDIYSTDNFTHVFSIDVPSLEDYSYRLFTVSHGIDSYPVTYEDENHLWQALADEGKFTFWLKQTLSSEKTKRILNTLAGQAGKGNPFGNPFGEPTAGG